MKAAVTVSPAISQFAPIIYRGNMEHGITRAAELGYDGVEVNGRIDLIDGQLLRRWLRERNLDLASLAVGASASYEGAFLSSPKAESRQRATRIMRRTIDLASEFGAVAFLGLVVGALQQDEQEVEEGRKRALDGIASLADYAAPKGVRLALETINRFESSYVNTVAQGLQIVNALGQPNVGLLLDTFHMNIEEPNVVESFRKAGSKMFYLHASDSNRWPPGYGHVDFPAIAEVIQGFGYDGWISAELLPKPDAETAAEKSIEYYRRVFR